MTRRSAFSLIEILVVLGIGALMAAITFGTFSSVRDNNKRQSCQTNLTQIYTAARQYAQDYDGQMPYYSQTTINSANPEGGIGLWALYTYPEPGDFAGHALRAENLLDGNQPFASNYIRNVSSLHCPSDTFTRVGIPSSQLFATSNSTTRTLNTEYLSYGVQDDHNGQRTYSSFRSAGEKNQLKYYTGSPPGATTPARPPADGTIITWCKWHRRLDNSGNTVASEGNADIVLFYDGSVRTVPINADASNLYCATPNGTTCFTGWQRKLPAPQ